MIWNALALLGTILFLLSPISLCASWFYPKAEDGHYRLEKWVPLETETIKKIFRWIGWGGLVLGFPLMLWFNVVFA